LETDSKPPLTPGKNKTSVQKDPKEDAKGYITSLEKENIQRMVIADPQSVAPILKTTFLNQLRDKRRSSEKSPKHKLYRRATENLRKAEGYFTHAPDKKYVAFSKYKENHSTAPLAIEDLEAVELPQSLASLSDFEAINRKEALLGLADHFYEQVSRQFQDNRIWIGVWDLIDWIFIKYRLNQKLIEKSLDEKDEHPVRESEIASPLEDHDFSVEKVEQWAHKAALELEQRDQVAFYLRHAENYSLAQIAQILGYSGPSGPSYALERAEDKLRSFLRDKDGLAPDDLNREALSYFFDKLFSILKKSPAMPSDISGQ
jgi:hypothetical protein